MIYWIPKYHQNAYVTCYTKKINLSIAIFAITNFKNSLCHRTSFIMSNLTAATTVKDPDKIEIKLNIAWKDSTFQWLKKGLSVTYDHTTSSALLLEKRPITEGEDVTDSNTKVHEHGTTGDAKYFLKPDFIDQIKSFFNDTIAKQAIQSFLSAKDRNAAFQTFFTQLWQVSSIDYTNGTRTYSLTDNDRSQQYLHRTINDLWTAFESSTSSAPETLDLTINLNSIYPTTTKEGFNAYNMEHITVDPLQQYKTPAITTSPTDTKLLEVLEGHLDAIKDDKQRDDKIIKVLESQLDVLNRKNAYLPNDIHDNSFLLGMHRPKATRLCKYSENSAPSIKRSCS